MEYRYDTVIIGAGPAGMGAAIRLTEHQADVCVIDKAVFPRNKTCAGLVTGKTYQLIESLYSGVDIESLFCCTSDKVRLFQKTELLVDSTLDKPVRLVNRSHFDNALVGEYKRRGGVIREGESRIKIDYEHNRITLSNSDVIIYQTLLFADGAMSLSRRLLPVDNRKLAFGIELYLPSEVFDTKSVDLYFDYLDSGYIWVFPHGDTVCIGAANQYDKKTDYRKLLTDFLTDIGVECKKPQYIGAFLPYGYVVPQEKLPDHIMLLGDAGGFADPISGEGLYMALKTGVCAADALQTAEPKKTYLSNTKSLSQIIKDGKKTQKVFYSSAVQKLFLNKVRGREKLVSYFFGQMVDEYHYEYRDIYKLFGDYTKFQR